MTFTPGQNIGPYQIIAQLGQGGMATVFKAYHANLDRYVAIKVLHVALREDESFLERFKREAQIVARLEHRHIVPVYDYADFENHPYLVMKFIEGQTLKQYSRKSPPTLEDVTTILTAVADALDYAHQHDVLHRDVKPSNIIIEKNGSPYLTDFGLARIASRGESTLSQDMMVGTPQYISPEQAQGNVHLDAGTDIYSLGVVLYELVVGRVPYNADTPYAIIHDHIYKPLPIPTQVNPAVTGAVERVLLKALAKKSEDRFKSAGEMATAFKNAVTSSQMKEISHHTLRPEAFLAQPASASQSVSKEIEVTIEPVSRNAAPSAPAVAPDSAGSWSASPASPYGASPISIPAPIPGAPPGSVLVQGSSITHRNDHAGNIWIFGGCLIFVLTCLLSAGIIINTISDPRYKNNSAEAGNTDVLDSPAEGDATDSPEALLSASELDEEILRVAREASLTTGQAQQYLADYPNEPSAHFAVALMQVENGNVEDARQTMQQAVATLNPSADLLADWAQVMILRDYSYQAMLLYVTAYSLAPDNADIRNQAGTYIYNQASRVQLRELTPFCALGREYSEVAFVDAMVGQAVLSVATNPESASLRLCANADLTEAQQVITLEALIRRSIELETDLAEGYLILGNYYEKIGDHEQAAQNWQQAIDLPESPAWVKTRAQNNLDAVEN